MNFGRQDQDDEVIRLLGMLRDSGPEYPSSMFGKRRAAVMAAFAALNLGASVAGLSLLAHLAKIIKAMGVVEKIILGVEVAAVTGLTVAGAATAYKYRDNIQQILQSNLGIVTSTPWPSLSAPLPGNAVGETELPGTGTPTATPTPTGTWFTPTNITGPQPTQPVSASSTPEPPGGGNCSDTGPDNGNCTHTPHPTNPPNTPKPTKDSGGGGGNKP